MAGAGARATSVTTPTIVPSVAVTTVPSISLADVHPFDVSTISDFGDIEPMLPIPPVSGIADRLDWGLPIRGLQGIFFSTSHVNTHSDHEGDEG